MIIYGFSTVCDACGLSFSWATRTPETTLAKPQDCQSWEEIRPYPICIPEIRLPVSTSLHGLVVALLPLTRSGSSWRIVATSLCASPQQGVSDGSSSWHVTHGVELKSYLSYKQFRNVKIETSPRSQEHECSLWVLSIQTGARLGLKLTEARHEVPRATECIQRPNILARDGDDKSGDYPDNRSRCSLSNPIDSPVPFNIFKCSGEACLHVRP